DHEGTVRLSHLADLLIANGGYGIATGSYFSSSLEIASCIDWFVFFNASISSRPRAIRYGADGRYSTEQHAMTSRSWRLFSVIRLHGINRCGRVGIEYWLLTLVMAGTPIFAQTPVPPIAPDGELYGMLVTRIDEQKCGTGVVVGILEPEGKRVVAYGTMGIDDERPVDGDTVFDIGSITKVFTALLLSDMVQRGEVALDDPAQKYVPAGVHLPTRAGRRITLADLATHTA